MFVTPSAKDLALKRNTLKKSTKKHTSLERSVDPFDGMEVDQPPGSSSARKSADRHSTMSKFGERQWTISNIKTKIASIRKVNSTTSPPQDYPEEISSHQRRDKSVTGSVFYGDGSMAVTTNLSEPADFQPLDLKGKTMNELLMLLKPVILLYCP